MNDTKKQAPKKEEFSRSFSKNTSKKIGKSKHIKNSLELIKSIINPKYFSKNKNFFAGLSILIVCIILVFGIFVHYNSLNTNNHQLIKETNYLFLDEGETTINTLYYISNLSKEDSFYLSGEIASSFEEDASFIENKMNYFSESFSNMDLLIRLAALNNFMVGLNEVNYLLLSDSTIEYHDFNEKIDLVKQTDFSDVVFFDENLVGFLIVNNFGPISEFESVSTNIFEEYFDFKINSVNYSSRDKAYIDAYKLLLFKNLQSQSLVNQK